MQGSIGDKFQQQTKYDRDKPFGKQLDWSAKPDTYKSYPESKTIKLPAAKPNSDMSVHEALKTRRSVRSYSQRPLKINELSYLLWSSTGISDTSRGFAFRTAPSAGALYPIETYIAVNNAEKLSPGVYHYNIRKHCLEQLREADVSGETARAALGQQMCAQAPAVFIWTAVFQRMKWKYGQRAYRYIYLDAGHIAENLALASASLGLGSCQIAAIFDDQVNKIIGVDGTEESTVYMSVAG
ncbi:SagB-type dehydrogenase domain protein [Sedimentisphaera cyanobacteriorum]|uniref:SagB-type dehydrogenase domain protein n=1 Tax=Sedimentisphaera cyanobacteriorum TaxID=1940790 RepID=A0A1Q2HM24_9BACT|nr:SagB/ThcOx family dehydrogenase [Sedimentisphaera cyanobacteriorum]AQQ08305.1 SagB-type dehydrogenase domain protein [Sedimentisphaera cyanobacteriorum]